ncbi:MAG: hypothetical protein H6737_08765 [Alphaproteobacteria bacterium]|nr:hypothetical protein [Alphaproteobacteria bacterium]
MAGWTELFELVGGRWPMEEQGTAERLQMAIRAAGAAVLFAAVYGLAAGSTDMALALGNLWKLPMLVVLSTLCSLPAGLLAWKLSGASDGASKLVVGVAAGNFAATLVLAALSPLVALYYNSSAYWGGPLAMGTVALALVVGLFSAWRLMLRAGSARLPFGVLAVVQMLALLQFTHIASPILPEQTFFDLGVDGLVDR